MDKNQLNKEIETFLTNCKERQKPVKEYCLNEAYPGDSSTSYFFDLKADWINEDDCFDAIRFFTEVMFSTMTEEARRKIFSIRVFTDQEKLHCDSGEIHQASKKSA